MPKVRRASECLENKRAMPPPPLHSYRFHIPDSLTHAFPCDRHSHPFDTRRVLDLNSIGEASSGELCVIQMNIDVGEPDEFKKTRPGEQHRLRYHNGRHIKEATLAVMVSRRVEPG